MFLSALQRAACAAAVILAVPCTAPPLFAAEPTAVPTPERARFFEEQVRPVLADNCFKCHGSEKQKGELRLDSRAAVLAGGETGPAVVPGKPEESLLVEAINHQSIEMPPEGKLKETEIAALTEWIRLGAPWPGEKGPGDQGAGKISPKRGKITAADRAFWSFQPLKQAAPPQIAGDRWSRGAIDQFVLARLQSAGLGPADEAAPEMLVRRLYFDLTGLPPTPAELDGYLADSSPNRYEALVDRLLASPRYGERWARHWLDLVRYAESDGYKQDDYRPHAWRYRDYVIDAFNADKPYDRFVREQLAGDELAPHDPAALAATGYLRAGIYEYNAKDARTQWDFILNDITDVTADVFLGLGMSCARCHDHKFDPILQEDYFRLRAFFAPLLLRDDVPLATPAELAAHNAKLAVWQAQTAELRRELDDIERPNLQKAADDEIRRFPAEIQALIRLPRGERTPLEDQLAELANRQVLDKMRGVNFEKSLQGETQERWKQLKAELKSFDAVKPAPLPAAYTVSDVGAIAPPNQIPASRRGAAKDVAPGFLTILDAEPATIAPLAGDGESAGSQSTGLSSTGVASTGRRTALANWLTRADNPLTSRVIVNRVWQQHFGRGLVGTTSDFGVLGDRPSHPELLDYLAAQFVAGGWRFKALHRSIVTSATYRQSALRPLPEQAVAIDPGNRLLWRMNSRRLEAEQIRDAMLAVSGDLNFAVGGEGVDAKQPRRSIFTKVIRNRKDALLDVFDVADGLLSTPQRNVTTTATQALLMINSDLTLHPAAVWAGRLQAESSADEGELVRRAYRAAFARFPTDSQANAAINFLHSVDFPHGGDRQQQLIDFCHALLNANEFIYVD